METDLIPKERPYRELFHDKHIEKGDYFARKARELYEGTIASILLMKGEDAGALIIVDDLNRPIMNQTLNEMKLKITQECFKENIEMGFNLMLASDLWKHFLHRTPQIFETLRNSYILHDIGFIRPLQELFVQGKIRPSKESRNVFFVKAEKGLKNSTKHMNAAMVDIYWAVVDVAHAAVMMAGITPPSPKELAKVLREELISRNLIHKRCADIMDEIYETAKRIMHKQKWDMTGKEFDRYMGEAEFFINEVTQFVRTHQDKKDKRAKA